MRRNLSVGSRSILAVIGPKSIAFFVKIGLKLSGIVQRIYLQRELRGFDVSICASRQPPLHYRAQNITINLFTTRLVYWFSSPFSSTILTMAATKMTMIGHPSHLRHQRNHHENCAHVLDKSEEFIVPVGQHVPRKYRGV